MMREREKIHSFNDNNDDDAMKITLAHVHTHVGSQLLKLAVNKHFR